MLPGNAGCLHDSLLGQVHEKTHLCRQKLLVFSLTIVCLLYTETALRKLQKAQQQHLHVGINCILCETVCSMCNRSAVKLCHKTHNKTAVKLVTTLQQNLQCTAVKHSTTLR